MYADKLIVVVLVHLKIKSIVWIIRDAGLVMGKFVNVLHKQKINLIALYKLFVMCPLCSNPFMSVENNISFMF
jgi:hypothetical protein